MALGWGGAWRARLPERGPGPVRGGVGVASAPQRTGPEEAGVLATACSGVKLSVVLRHAALPKLAPSGWAEAGGTRVVKDTCVGEKTQPNRRAPPAEPRAARGGGRPAAAAHVKTAGAASAGSKTRAGPPPAWTHPPSPPRCPRAGPLAPRALLHPCIHAGLRAQPRSVPRRPHRTFRASLREG